MNDELGIQNKNVKPMAHITQKPLSIEREYTLQGYEVIIIEGVRYDAEYFRTFAHPDTDVLYAVRSHDDTVVLTIIHNADEAQHFFEEMGGAAQEEEADGL